MSVLLHMTKFIHWVCVVNDKQVSHMFLVCTLFILKIFTRCFNFFLVDFEQILHIAQVFIMITFKKVFSLLSLVQT